MSQGASRLGRGLTALIRPTPPPANAATDPAPEPLVAAAVLREIAIQSIRPNPRQPRTRMRESALEELSASIKRSGVLQPVIVRSTTNGHYELIAGERRWRAARMAGLAHIPAIVRDADDAGMLELAMIENLQREDLGPLERARGYQTYVDAFGATPESLAVKLGESRSNVANYLRLLKLRPEVQAMIEADELAMGHARALAAVSDAARQLALARLAVRRNLSARQVEDLVRQAEGAMDEVASGRARETPTYVQPMEKELSRAIGLPVRLRPGKKKNSGRIVISYSSLDEFDRLAEQLGARSKIE